MNRLIEIGFEPAGHWQLNGDELAFHLLRHASQRNILYAFICDGEVKYIGKTVQTLYARMGGYKNPAPSQTTNVRNNARIKALLQLNAAVDILALPDNGLLHYGQFHLNLAAGLEDSLISIMSPEWNGNSTLPPIRPIDTTQTPELETTPVVAKPILVAKAQDPNHNPAVEQAPKCIASFPLTVHKTYYNQGFFNIGVSHASLFGTDGQEIEIFCGTAEQPIVGTINRTANNNKTPRIMGGKGLRDWFHQHMREMQEATIGVFSPTALRIQARES